MACAEERKKDRVTLEREIKQQQRTPTTYFISGDKKPEYGYFKMAHKKEDI